MPSDSDKRLPALLNTIDSIFRKIVMSTVDSPWRARLAVALTLAICFGGAPSVAAERLDARQLGVAYARCLAVVANRPAIARAADGDLAARHQAAKRHCARLRDAFTRQTAAEFRPQPEEVANSIEGRVLNALR